VNFVKSGLIASVTPGALLVAAGGLPASTAAGHNQELHNLDERLMRTGGDAQEHLDSGAVERLTTREREVLRLVAQGKTNAEVAHDLLVSVATVKTHIEHIIAKLEVSDRTQAAVRAVELGILIS
jgi:DNA-binding NarL/FixJ family response regulator